MYLYRVKEVSDLFVDACVRDESGRLLMLSIYGRDGAILEFFASFSLPVSQGGLSEFTLLDGGGQPSSVYVADANKLQKLSGRLPKAHVFGNLVHSFLYDPCLLRPDKANRIAWGLYPTIDSSGQAVADTEIHDRLWQQVKDLSPLPLLDDWRETVLNLPGEPIVQWLRDTLHPPLGQLEACRIELKPSFLERVSDAVRAGMIRLPGVEPVETHRSDPMTQQEPIAGEDLAGEAIVPEVPPIRLGQVGMTPGVADLRESHPGLLMKCLARHRMGDWGFGDREANERALKTGARLLSAYHIDETKQYLGNVGNTLWIITEWDRSVTTLLLPDEY